MISSLTLMHIRRLLILSLVCALTPLSGQAPIKSAQLSGTSQITSGTFTLQTGVVLTAAAGSTVNLSAGTLTLGTGQIGWTAVNKTGGAFTGDSGTGGVIGLVPAPAAGDAAAGKYLSAGGGWAAPASGGGATTFLGLTDTPDAYTGLGGRIVAVNTGATALEFLATLPWASVSKTGSSLADLVTRTATDLTSGTLPDARFPATLPAASGTNLTSLNGTQVTSGTVAAARLPVMVGDSGAGGTAGLVPAPAAGDAAAGKYLRAGGTWVAPAGGGASTFLGLTDTPDAYTGQGGKVLAVKADVTGIEFITGGGGGGVTYVTAPTSGTASGTAGALAFDTNNLYLCIATNTWRRIPLLLVGGAFNFVSDGDANGALYFLGTSLGTTSWTNPHTSGQVTVVTSALSSGSALMFVDRVANNSFTTNVANSFIGVDLGVGRTLAPTKYSIRNRSGGADNMPRNFKLQGTNTVSANTEAGWNAASWADLASETANATINADSAWGTFNVTGAASYRYLRVIQTGANSSGSNLFIVSEMEFYGTASF